MKKKYTFQFNKGYTLIELMVVVMIIAFFALVALPSYQTYTRKANAAYAQQEILKLADQLERHKTRNFSYKNFSTSSLVLAKGGYTLTVKDNTYPGNNLTSSTSLGQNWVILATSTNVQNMKLMMNSQGLKCQSVSGSAVDNNCSAAVCTVCESSSEAW